MSAWLINVNLAGLSSFLSSIKMLLYVTSPHIVLVGWGVWTPKILLSRCKRRKAKVCRAVCMEFLHDRALNNWKCYLAVTNICLSMPSGPQGTFLIYKEDKSPLLAQSDIEVTGFCSVYLPAGYSNKLTAHNEWVYWQNLKCMTIMLFLLCCQNCADMLRRVISQSVCKWLSLRQM